MKRKSYRTTLNSGMGVLHKASVRQLVQVLRLQPFLELSQVVLSNKIHNGVGKHMVCIRMTRFAPLTIHKVICVQQPWVRDQVFSCSATRSLENCTSNLQFTYQDEFQTLSLKEMFSNNNCVIGSPIAFYSTGKKLIIYISC